MDKVVSLPNESFLPSFSIRASIHKKTSFERNPFILSNSHSYRFVHPLKNVSLEKNSFIPTKLHSHRFISSLKTPILIHSNRIPSIYFKPFKSSEMPTEILIQALPNNKDQILNGTANGSKNEPKLKKLIIPNKEGEKLVGLFNDVGSKSISILCHGFRSSKNSGSLIKLENGFAEADICTFRFDFSGNGESEGKFAFGNYYKEVEDLHSIVDYFINEGYSMASILGHSKGGNVVLLYASKYRNVSCVVNVCGRCLLTEGVLKRFGKEGMNRLEKEGSVKVEDSLGSYIVTKESLNERFSIDMVECCKQISPQCRVITIHGSKDEVVPVSDARVFASTIPNHSLKIVDGAMHNFREHYDILVKEAVSFVTN